MTTCFLPLTTNFALAAITADPKSHVIETSKKSRVIPKRKNPPPSLSLLAKCNSLKQLQQIHATVVKSDLQDDIPTLTKLINFCFLVPSATMDYAQHLFDRISQPDAVLFNTMSRGYSRTHDPLRAVVIFRRMLDSGISPDDYTFPSLGKACANAKALEEGKQVHCVAAKLGLDGNAYVHPTLVNMYAECGDMEAARKLFDQISQPCIVSYNAMITAYARSSRPNEALALFRELQAKILKPTEVTMLSVLSSCALLGALELGKWIHEYIKKHGFDHSVSVNTALIGMYAKCGSLEDAVRVFEKMHSRDRQAWSAMIVAYAIHGHATKAISLFEEMKTMGVRPDEITFLGVLYACSHTGLVDEGRNYYQSMRNDYGISPTIKHYGCMVDLLGRAGLLTEAYDFILNLPIKPTPILWRTLLSACGVHNNVELGKQVVDQIFKLEDTHGGDYVILSNMCAASGKWEDVNYIRGLMKDRGVTKVPGCSSIEVKNVVHEFFSGDGGHPQSEELHRLLDELVERLKLVGYVPNTSQVFHPGMTEAAKEATLRYHSEKLAIAFGLLNTPPGMTIRVVKNLRVCPDCHSAAKFISMVSCRQIVLRDLHRFHHFKDGLCSCGDYW